MLQEVMKMKLNWGNFYESSKRSAGFKFQNRIVMFQF